jgi:hypothetical protein
MANNTTLEQWMLAQSLAGAIRACNAPFCCEDDEEEEVNRDRSYVENVASELAGLCSPMAIEDAIQVLECALRIHEAQTAVSGQDEEPSRP